jgi:multiple sugar transport system substrate-binding protein
VVAVVTLLLAAPASAATEIEVLYAIPNIFKDVHEKIAAEFMAKHKDIRVKLRAPAESYEEGAERVLRDAITNKLPDVAYHGLNRQRIFVDRDIAVPVTPLIEKEKNWAAQGFSPAMNSLGVVQGKQYGMGFSISTPIIYYNLDLVQRAGADPAKLPATWDELFALAKRIERPAEKIGGFHFDWDITGNWMWQALVFSYGGSMLTADEKRVAFDGPAGQQAIGTLSRMITDGTMKDISQATALQDFVSGRLGIWSHSTSRLGGVTKQVGDKFRLRTHFFPVSSANGARLPAGGNVAMLFAKDPAKQRAAWEYIKFACGPVGATIMVNGTGYMPANELPGKDPALLGKFYEQNPNHLTTIKQLPLMTGWYAFPGENALKITDVIKDHLQTVVSRAKEPQQVLRTMAADVQPLLPR